jgi:hypothetical protein
MDDKQENIYVKLPYINEELKRRALSVIRRSGINNVQIHFMNGRPSSRVERTYFDDCYQSIQATAYPTCPTTGRDSTARPYHNLLCID